MIMTDTEIKNTHREIIQLLIQKRVKDALDRLHKLIVIARRGEFRNQYENNLETYKYILKYLVDGIEDPEREKVYNKLLLSTLKLADKVKESLLTQQSGMEIYRIKSDFEKRMGLIKEEAVEAVSDLSFDNELNTLLRDAFLKKDESKSREDRDRVLTHLFNLIWLTDEFYDADIQLIQSIRKSKHLPWYEQCIMVSALTLSLVRIFDIHKINLLFDFYEDGVDQVWHRALVGLILGLYIHDERLFLYPELQSRLEILKDNQGLTKQIEQVIIQLLRSQDTERISRKLQEEIIPDMMKIKPRLEDKLDLDSLMSDEFMEDKNPDWEEFFKDTPDLYEKMQEFTNMQMEGADVFWSAFAMLKHFSFFKVIHNWFMPFHTGNKAVNEILEGEKEYFDPGKFVEGISQSAFLCNSDKYSFCLNIKHIPASQKSLLMEFFNAELENMSEMMKDEKILNKPSLDKFIFTQYIQDLYRFHKLHPLRNEFLDVFSARLDFYSTSFFDTLVDDPDTFRNIGEFYFEKNDYSNAFKVYELLNRKGDVSYEVYEKMGYSKQRLGKYQEALKYYLKAELFDKNRNWLLKKIGLCYQRTGDIDHAIKYYKEILDLEPENLFVISSLGYCFLAKENYEEAQNYFYKMELISPGDVKVLRPLAWVSFLRGMLDTAHRHYQEILHHDPGKHDYMNMGHVEWCMGERARAIDHYRMSIRQKDHSLEQFLASFEEDKQHLVSRNIPEEEIYLMLDHLKFTLDEMA